MSMRQSETPLAPTPSSRALVVQPRPAAMAMWHHLVVRPPEGAVPFTQRTGSRLSRWFGIIAIPVVFAAGGYLANDPYVRRAADFQATLLTSGGISTAEPTADGGDLALGPIPRHAYYLFEEGRKGPRADRHYASLAALNNATEVEKTGTPAEGDDRLSANGIRRGAKSASLASGVAVQDEEGARPENAGLMANASFFVMASPAGDGLFNALAPGGGTESGDAGWGELIKNARLSPEQPKTIFGGLTEEEFRERELRCMATAVYFEARGEPYRGQVAVGQVIMNRIRSPIYPKTICGVVFQGHLNRDACQFSFACDGKPDRATSKEQWATALKVAKQVLARDVWLDEIGYATHYHADYVSPDWRNLYQRVAKIGVHIFYKPPPGGVQVAFAVDDAPADDLTAALRP